MEYKYDQLSEEAKEKAKEWYGEAFNDAHCMNVTEWYKYELDRLGLPTEDICWRLSYSQGDGMAFYGRVDLLDFLTKNKLKSKWYRKLFDRDGNPLCTVNIVRNCWGTHYDHWNTMTVDMDFNLYGGYDNDSRAKHLSDFEEFLQDFIRDVSKRLEKEGYDSLEGDMKEDVVRECMAAHEYTFTEEGERA